MIINKSIQLLPDSAVLIESGLRFLIAADLHLGKSAVFRANGLPVPEGDTRKDLERLTQLILEYQPDHLVIAGDLFHANSGFEEEVIDVFEDFLRQIRIPFTLVKGNHDDKIASLPESFDMCSHREIGDIRIVHKPQDASPELFNICGHIHPVVRIADGKNTVLRPACFHLRDNVLTLPSFGSFTGGQIVKPQPEDRFFVSHLGKVIEIPGKLIK
ncbi:ligase-associated DNA damage response endonuclease PdeM [Luteolibacter algae]|uniref:Ligase-associated DNA damage response endonuclease PdeM n=1 Tax=Luteolibacter algae TaxID=454151 RepID=A0ABW5DBU3_9BACT